MSTGSTGRDRHFLELRDKVKMPRLLISLLVLVLVLLVCAPPAVLCSRKARGGTSRGSGSGSGGGGRSKKRRETGVTPADAEQTWSAEHAAVLQVLVSRAAHEMSATAAIH